MQELNINSKIVLSVDPGYDRSGVAVVCKEAGLDSVIFSECINTDKKDKFEDRLFFIGKRLEEIIETYKPNAVAIETLFLFKNQKTVIGVAEARGVVLYIAGKNKIPVYEYSPMQIKSNIAGDGHADKKQVKFMLERILKNRIDLDKKKDDELDAIACGLTALAYLKNI